MSSKIEDGTSELRTTRLKQLFIIIFAAVAFAMTAYATSGGARIFLNDSYAWIGITALAVGFLAFTSVVLGDGISASRITQVALVLPFYLVAVAICWISSFASYQTQFLSVDGTDLANAESNLRQMGFYANEINQDLNDRFVADKNALLKNDALEDYSASLATLADELRDRDKKKEVAAELENLIEAKRAELRNAQAELQNEQRDRQTEADRVARQLQTAEKAVADKQKQATSAENLVRQIETALREEAGDPNLPADSNAVLLADSLASKVVDDPACQRRRRVGTGGGLIGTCYNALTVKLAKTQELVKSSKRDLDSARLNLQTARQQQADMQIQLEKLDREVKAAAAQAKDGFASGYTLDADGFLQSVNAFIDKPSQATFKNTAEYCYVVTEVISGLQSFSDIPACEPQAVMTIFRQVETLEAENARYTNACDDTEGRKQIVETLRQDLEGLSGTQRLKPISHAYDTMRSQVLEGCVLAAEQRGLDVAAYRQDILGFVDRINPTQDPISAAMGKVQSLFSGTASARDYFPALLALLQELSLLLSKLFWDASIVAKTTKRKDDLDIADLDLDPKPDDPDSVLAAKNIALNAVFDKQGYRLHALFDDDYSQDMRNQMRLILDALVRKQLARKAGQGIMISEAGMAEIARRIARHSGTTQTPVAATPAPKADPVMEAEVVEAAAPAVEPKAKAPEQKTAKLVPLAEEKADDLKATASETETEAQSETVEDADVENVQRPRRRRPVVVRPNFRREI